jgi:hypothetical protein
MRLFRFLFDIFFFYIPIVSPVLILTLYFGLHLTNPRLVYKIRELDQYSHCANIHLF